MDNPHSQSSLQVNRENSSTGAEQVETGEQGVGKFSFTDMKSEPMSCSEFCSEDCETEEPDLPVSENETTFAKVKKELIEEGRYSVAITLDNAIQVYCIARDTWNESLKADVCDFICRNGTYFMTRCENIEELGWEDFSKILESDYLNVKREAEVLEGVMRWADRLARGDTEKFLDLLSLVIKKVRFFLMSFTELCRVLAVCNPVSQAIAGGNARILYNLLIVLGLDDVKDKKIKKKLMQLPFPFSSKPRLGSSMHDEGGVSPMDINPFDSQLNEEDFDDVDDVNAVVNVQANPDEAPYDDFETVLENHYVAEVKKKSMKNERVGSISITGVKINHKYTPLPVASDVEIKLDLDCLFLGETDDDDMERMTTFLEFIRDFDPFRYLRFQTSQSERDNGIETVRNLGDVWYYNKKTELTIKGVKLIYMDRNSDDLALNYCRFVKKLLYSSRLVHLKQLALSNSHFDYDSIVESKLRKLKSLVLFRVWGDFTPDQVVSACPVLEEFVCWKYFERSIPGAAPALKNRPVLTFSSTQKSRWLNLKKLVLYKVELKFETMQEPPTTAIEELCLEQCKVDLKSRSQWADYFSKLFPNVREVILVNQERSEDASDEDRNEKGVVPFWRFPATPHVLNTIIKLKNVVWVRIGRMRWQPYNKSRPALIELEKFLGSLGLPPKPTNFILKKKVDENDFVNESRSSSSSSNSNMSSTFRRVDEDSTVRTTRVKAAKEGWEAENWGKGNSNDYFTMTDELEFDWYSLQKFYTGLTPFQDYFIGDGDGVPKFPRKIFW